MSEKNYDFFISYNHKDENYATWIAWLLEKAGYKVFIQAWDFGAGNNFILEMQKGASQAYRTLALISENYLSSAYTQPEWAAAFGSDPTGSFRKLIPVRIQDIEMEGLLPQIIYIDLVEKNENEAKEEILKGVQLERKKPTTAPLFPGIIPKLEKPIEMISSDWYEVWLNKRIKELQDNGFANSIMNGAKIVLHLIPLESITKNVLFEIQDLKQPSNLEPFYTTGWNYKVNKDGYCTYAQWPETDTPHGYVQFFRNGIIEAVDMGILQTRSNNKFIPYVKFEKDIIKHIKKYLEAIKTINIKLPVAVSITLLNIKDYYVSGNPQFSRDKINVDTLRLPVVLIDSWDSNIDRILKKSFDYLWNHCGFEGSLNYDADGNWRDGSSQYF